MNLLSTTPPFGPEAKKVKASFLGDFCAFCAKRWMTESVIVEGFEKNGMKCNNNKFFIYAFGSLGGRRRRLSFVCFSALLACA